MNSHLFVFHKGKKKHVLHQIKKLSYRESPPPLFYSASYSQAGSTSQGV